jgi:hypothetical protein
VTLEETAALMRSFADRTGLTSDAPVRRYLWTDAFAVCNYVELRRLTGDERHMDLALELIHQVHHVLGRHREDDSRAGWISGLGEEEGQSHPTAGGLRIGKKLRERSAGEPFDEKLEWERDGQYFHYLTKWMHALDQVAGATGELRFNSWARELAEVAHAKFACGPPGGRRMVWKMSTDLSRPLVSSMGQHDPLDGLVTCVQLETTASLLPGATLGGPSLKEAAADYAMMLEATDLRTADPLSLGGLLSDSCRVAQLESRGALRAGRLLRRLLAAALEGLALYSRRGEWREAASRRLAFRELGLAIGLSSINLIQKLGPAEQGVRGSLDALASYREIGSAIVSFWLHPEHRETRPWSEHRDINEVMLATSLVPEGHLFILPVG